MLLGLIVTRAKRQASECEVALTVTKSRIFNSTDRSEL